MTSYCRPLAAAALLCAAAAPAYAEDQYSTIIVTAPDVADPLRRPGGAGIVPAEDHAGSLSVSLRDALAFAPGVYAQPRFGQEVRLSIRGSGISRAFHMRGITLLQDGIPVNLADDNGDFQELDPQAFDRIEVYRGANALRFGGSTLGGAVNGVTPTGRSHAGVGLRIDGGAFGTLRGRISYGHDDGRGDVWLSLSGDRSDGDRDHARRQSLRFHGNAGLRLSDHVETRFYAAVQGIDQEMPGALTIADVLEAPRTGQFALDQQRNIRSIRLQNRTTIALGGATVTAGLFANLKALDHPIFQVIDQVSTDHGAFARLDGARGPLAFTLGATARFGRVAARRYVNDGGTRGALTMDADQRARTIDVYGEARYRLGPVQLIAGGIFTHGRRAQEQIVPLPASASATFDQLSPKLGLLWEAAPEVQIYASYSRSAELPGLSELAQVAGFVPLAPQRAWTAELGGRGRIGAIAFDISLYRARIAGELLQFTVDPDIPAATFNAGETVHQGIEAAVDLRLARWAELRQVWLYSDFRFRDDRQYGDNRLPVVPRHLYRAALRLGTDRAAVTPILEWVPEGAWADYRNSFRPDGYVLLGARAELALPGGLILFADARNLNGERGAGDVGAVIAWTPGSAIFYPVERRAIYGGVRAHF